MRTQAERDEQTIDIMSAVLVATLLWILPLIALAVLAHAVAAEGSEEVVVVAALGFVATLIRRLS